jgi:hypothetical protein
MNIIYCFWTGDNEMSDNRKSCLDQLIKTSECKVILVTKNNLYRFILPNKPLHEAYKYLSETHKADYLRTYFMRFIGGGYSDIKKTSGSWIKHFTKFRKSKYWICGYCEVPGGVAYAPYADKYLELVGNGAYICKANTPLVIEWYNSMIQLLDNKLYKLKLNPSIHPLCCAENSMYPIEWNEMLGRIFHKVSYKYKEKLLNTLPTLIFTDYR